MDVRVVTNGSAPFRRWLENLEFAEALTRVAVSLDHFSDASVLQLRGKRGFHDALETGDMLLHLSVPFAINCTVTSLLAPQIGEMIDFCERLGASRLNLHWLSPVGRGRERPDLVVPPEEWEGVLDTVGLYRSPRQDFVVDCEIGWMTESLADRAESFSCATRDRTNLQFMPDGRVFSCGLLAESPTLNGYKWRDGALWRRRGTNEVSITAQQHHCVGCPIRETRDEYRFALPPNAAPACIYQRLIAPESLGRSSAASINSGPDH
jgi:MoaA/NifB/PqqE/SkfB family radical SAM enzyme